jgi:uncharacterized membrane protein
MIVRWLHVVAPINWIGRVLFHPFDRSLQSGKDLSAGVSGRLTSSWWAGWASELHSRMLITPASSCL